MANAESVIAEFKNFLASELAPDEIAAFHLSPKSQKYVAGLLYKNNAGTITEAELAELDRFLELEYECRAAKLNARQALAKAG
ncbi:MAG: hypothetical protein FJW32_17885 [Acidobacteria bacterium]|nr:hypothetical protein [Acidobacteriota bacterium]